ncbi:MAG TPA: hypothetical protein VLD18_08180, partial [Verrucomicrobiae bacterium]|nr:hypothetical protein [Verrucomicrobiae bacterium]
MRSSVPYLLLLPPVLLLGIWVASLFGYEPYPVRASAVFAGMSFWILMFLIIYGGLRGWRFVRAFIVVFILLSFGAVFYRQLVQELALYRLGLELAGAAVLSTLFYAVFWPEKPQRSNAQPSIESNGD